MPQKLPDEVPFHDASAYFSEEEWKLLHDWQKELYRNVMKEIHQALISLGPIIATTVFSLRTKEKEEPMPLKKSYSETRHCKNQSSSDVITAPDALFRTQRAETQYLMATHDTEGRDRNENIQTGLPFLGTNLCLRQEEQASIFIDHLGVEVGDSNTSTHRDPEQGHKVVSFQIKGEEEAYYMGHQENARTEHFSSATDEGIVRQKWTAEDTIKFTEKMSTQIDFVDEEKVNVLQRPEMASNSRSQRWGENNQKPKGKKEVSYECGFMNQMHSSLHEEPYKMVESDLDNEHECNTRNTTFVTFPENTVQHFRQLSKKSKESTSHKSHLFGNQKSSTTEKKYQCNECDKGFNRKQHFIGHLRTHTGERPYQCTQCARSFSQMHNLARHQRSHIGKKPYQCIQCGKSFSRKDNLVGHQRAHLGERPYGCTECSKKFSQKQNLIRHLRTHM